jgi:hypothetical protein
MKAVKIARFERMARTQRDYHRMHPWQLSKDGLFIPYSYSDAAPDGLSWWNEVGFILNGRRVMVWWQHPRYVYWNEAKKQARTLAGEDPGDDWLIDGAIRDYRHVGRSRKEVVGHATREPSEAQQQYYEHHWRIREELMTQGIDSDAVRPTFKRERLWWATGVELVAPLEVRNESELAGVAALVRRLLLGHTTLGAEFPAYSYGQADWLAEQPKRSEAEKTTTQP